MKRLENKVAIITGGNSGMGAAAAELFAQEGASVVIFDLKKDGQDFDAVANKIKAAGGNAIAIPGDVTDVASCKNCAEKAVEAFGKIDVLVNSAGILDHNQGIQMTTPEMYYRVIAINQTGVFNMCREVLPYMEKNNNTGSIINISSLAGVSADAGSSYSMSKHAVVGLSRNIAIQYAGTGIRCNTICPGPTDTPMVSGSSNSGKVDHALKAIEGRHHNSDVGWADAMDQAYAMLYFASDESKAVTMQTLCIDRGFCNALI